MSSICSQQVYVYSEDGINYGHIMVGMSRTAVVVNATNFSRFESASSKAINLTTSNSMGCVRYYNVASGKRVRPRWYVTQ